MKREIFGLALLLYVVAPPEARCQGAFSSGGWSGPYIGLTGGGALSDIRQSVWNRESPNLRRSAFAGYGVQVSDFYLGGEVEGLFDGIRYHSSSLMSYAIESDWTAVAQARVGWAPASGLLIYATAGPAWSGRTAKIDSLGSDGASFTQKVQGFAFGGGIEVKLAPAITARIEAIRVDFSSERPTLFNTVNGATSINWKSLAGEDTTIRAGISLRLN